MTIIKDFHATEVWQAEFAGAAERGVDRLEDTLGELITLTQNREGYRFLVANHRRLRAAIVKFRDLVVETMPAREK